MPIYVYEHPKSGKQVEVVQGIDDEHSYTDKKGLKWNRVFTPPNVLIDSKIDPFSESDFLEKTKSKKGSIGDLMDRSAELSDKRAQKAGGVDPIKERFFKEYSKKRRGKKHEADPARYKKLKKMGAIVSSS